MRPPSRERKRLGKYPKVVFFLSAIENDRIIKENDAFIKRIKELESQSKGEKFRTRELQTKLYQAIQHLQNARINSYLKSVQLPKKITNEFFCS